MDHKEFEQIVDTRLAHCRKVLCEKGEEYSRDGDRLHNFKSCGRKRKRHPLHALQDLAAKHEVSIDDIVNDIVALGKYPTRKMLDEKITDAINYLLLLEGLIVDQRDEAEFKTPFPNLNLGPGQVLYTPPQRDSKI